MRTLKSDVFVTIDVSLTLLRKPPGAHRRDRNLSNPGCMRNISTHAFSLLSCPSWSGVVPGKHRGLCQGHGWHKAPLDPPLRTPSHGNSVQAKCRKWLEHLPEYNQQQFESFFSSSCHYALLQNDLLNVRCNFTYKILNQTQILYLFSFHGHP